MLCFLSNLIRPQNYKCHFCDVDMVTELSNKTGTASILATALTSLICCCCIGYNITSFKDVQHSCSNCHRIVGVRKRI